MNSTNGSEPLLQVENLFTRYPVARGIVGVARRQNVLYVRAVDGAHIQHVLAARNADDPARNRIAGEEVLDLEQRLGSVGAVHAVVTSSRTTSFRWQAAMCASPTRLSSGVTVAHGWKARS